MIALHNILVATDFGPAAGAALTYGRALAQTFGARLHVLHALENSFLRGRSGDPHAHEAAILQRLHEQVTADDRTTLAAHVALETSDHPAEAITQYATSASIDLIVSGDDTVDGRWPRSWWAASQSVSSALRLARY
jgi:nucleotide-binding universal stress UspA family protein